MQFNAPRQIEDSFHRCGNGGRELEDGHEVEERISIEWWRNTRFVNKGRTHRRSRKLRAIQGIVIRKASVGLGGVQLVNRVHKPHPPRTIPTGLRFKAQGWQTKEAFGIDAHTHGLHPLMMELCGLHRPLFQPISRDAGEGDHSGFGAGRGVDAGAFIEAEDRAVG